MKYTIFDFIFLTIAAILAMISHDSIILLYAIGLMVSYHLSDFHEVLDAVFEEDIDE